MKLGALCLPVPDSEKHCSPQQMAVPSWSEPAPRTSYEALNPAAFKSTWTFPAQAVREDLTMTKGDQPHGRISPESGALERAALPNRTKGSCVSLP